jgi:hypothetical protein
MAACQSTPKLSPEEAIKQATENFDNVTSMTFTMDMGIDMNVMSQDMEMAITGDGEYIREPLATSIIMEMESSSAGSEKASVAAYITEDEDGAYVLYTGTGEEGSYTWTKQEMASLEEAQKQTGVGTSVDQMNEFFVNGSDFVEAGTEDVNGTQATRYDGVVTKEKMMEAMDEMNMSSMFESMGLDEAAVNSYSESLENIKVSIWIDTANMIPVKYEIDMTEFMQSLMSAMLKEMVNQLGQSDMDVSEYFTISNVKAVMVITGTDNVDSIEIPEEALNA